MPAEERLIYFDHAATTPVAPEVLEAMLPFFSERYGNPSSIHRLGRESARAIDQSRQDIAHLLNCQPNEIVFTSCGTEADNLALRGVALAQQARGRGQHLIVSAVEHKAVLQTAFDLRDRYGFTLTVLPVDGDGLLSLADFEAALRPDTVLISVMYANNEIGTIQPLAQIGALARSRGITFHTDAVQAGGLLPLDVEDLQVDLLALSAHKFYGPKGIGLLYVRRGTSLWSQVTGGSQETKHRAGTENVPYIVGMAAALTLTQMSRVTNNAHQAILRDRLINRVLREIPDVRVSGHRTQRLPNHASFLLGGLEIQGVLMGLDMAGIAASSGSACTSAAQEPSHVLTALGIDPIAAAGHLRLTLGHSTTDADIEAVADALTPLVGRLRQMSAGEPVGTRL
ncbi:MAG: cysteine desulfurase [Anaerolineae bacterium]|nr:cysteine desulfurase [Anaerolineae bacterium]